MLRRATKLMVFLVLAVSIFMVLHKTVGLQKNVQLAQEVDIAEYKDMFLSAVQRQDLPDAKLNYETLKEYLPANDEFIETIAPAYMADLYIQYAQRMSFNASAYQRLLAEAELLAPEHPYLVKQQPLALLAAPPLDEKLLVLQQEVAGLEDLIIQEEQLIENELLLAENIVRSEMEHLKKYENQEKLLQHLHRLVPAMPELVEIEAKPVSVSAHIAQVQEQLHQQEPLTIAMTATIPETSDSCALAFYTRKSPLGACVDAIAKDYYGPGLFVIADADAQPMFAFTQAPVTTHEYDLFCHLSGQCYEEDNTMDAMMSQLQASGIELDLSEVQQTVTDYNRYCQMTKLCEPIQTLKDKEQRILSKGELQRYALWLTKETGNKYRLLDDSDSAAIYQHFQLCMQTGECTVSMLEQLATVFQEKNMLLVRELQ